MSTTTKSTTKKISDRTAKTIGDRTATLTRALKASGEKLDALSPEQAERATGYVERGEKGGLAGKALLAWIIEGKSLDVQTKEAAKVNRSAVKAETAKGADTVPEKIITEWIAPFVEAHATDDHDAPINELPFVHKGRLYLKAKPLTAFVVKSKLGSPEPGALAKRLAAVGFERQPFAFKLNGKQTGASHYSIPTSKIRGMGLPMERKPAEKKEAVKKPAAKKATKAASKTIAAKSPAAKKAQPRTRRASGKVSAKKAAA